MKTFLSAGVFFLLAVSVCAQKVVVDTGIVGVYKTTQSPNFTFEISNNNNAWSVTIVGMGTTPLTPLGSLRFEPQHIRPKATIQFFKDGEGHIDRLQFSQRPQTTKWFRLSGD